MVQLQTTHRLIDWSQKQLHTLSMESTITTVQYVTQQVYWHDTRQHVSHYDKYTQHNTATTGCPHAADVSTAQMITAGVTCLVCEDSTSSHFQQADWC